MQVRMKAILITNSGLAQRMGIYFITFHDISWYFMILPQAAHLGISAQLKIWKVLTCKMGHENGFIFRIVTHPPHVLCNHPPTQPSHRKRLLYLISQQPLGGSYSNLKLKLLGSNHSVQRYQMKTTSNGRRPPTEDNLKIWKVEYLSNHWSDLTQIWNLS